MGEENFSYLKTLNLKNFIKCSLSFPQLIVNPYNKNILKFPMEFPTLFVIRSTP